MKRRLIYFVLSLVVWVMVSWPFVEGGIDVQVLVAGLIASGLVAILFHEMLPKEHHIFLSPIRLFWFLVYVPVFAYYLVKANIDVLYRALHPQMPIRPGIVKIKTSLKSDSAITALANSITLTPGTLTVDLTEDGTLYIHWIYVKSDDVEEATRQIAGPFEWFIRRIFE
jgi:multicomponent Na+:H+ antiporter subunit E